VRLVAAILIGAGASAVNGELIGPFAPVFVVIDGTLVWLGATLAAALVARRAGHWRSRTGGRDV
jgi:hypothetical protein